MRRRSGVGHNSPGSSDALQRKEGTEQSDMQAKDNTKGEMKPKVERRAVKSRSYGSLQGDSHTSSRPPPPPRQKRPPFAEKGFFLHGGEGESRRRGDKKTWASLWRFSSCCVFFFSFVCLSGHVVAGVDAGLVSSSLFTLRERSTERIFNEEFPFAVAATRGSEGA